MKAERIKVTMPLKLSALNRIAIKRVELRGKNIPPRDISVNRIIEALIESGAFDAILSDYFNLSKENTQ